MVAHGVESVNSAKMDEKNIKLAAKMNEKSAKSAAKMGEKSAKSAMMDVKNFRSARMDGDTIESAKMNGGSVWMHVPEDLWLRAFEEKSKQSLYEAWEEEGEPKVYESIKRAVKKIRKIGGKQYEPRVPTSSSSTDGGEYHRESQILKELAEILRSIDEKELLVRRGGILQKANEDWHEDWKFLKKKKYGSNEIQQRADEMWKTSNGKVVVHALCLVEPTSAFEILEDFDNSAFGGAAKRGATEIVKVMLEELMIYLRRDSEKYPDLEKALRDKINMKPEAPGSSSAFLSAAKELRLGVLRLLLEHCPSLADMDSLKATITNTAPGDEGKRKEEQDMALEAFKLILENMTNLGDMTDIWTQAVKARSLKVVKYLIEKHSAQPTYENAALIVKEGTAEMWKSFTKETQANFLKQEPCDLLHKAVNSQNADIIDIILKDFPEQIEQRAVITKEKKDRRDKITKGPLKNLGEDPPETYKKSPETSKQIEQEVIITKEEGDRGDEIKEYPLENLGKVPPETDKKSLETYKNIRDLLLHAMIRSSSSNLVEADTICLHLSTINTEEQRFAEYVDWLTHPKSMAAKTFKFEKILKYANFPDLNSQTPSNSLKTIADLQVHHNEIKMVFKWLEARPVQEVLELSVPDQLLCPHSDEDVEYCVNNFAVRVLNWRKLDLYLPRLKTTLKPEQDPKLIDTTTRENLINTQLHELHLYSSGNQSVLDQWYHELKNFRNLRKLYIYVVTDVLGQMRADKVKEQVQKELDKINKALGYQWTKHLDNNEHVPVSNYTWAKEGTKMTYRKLDEITYDVVGPDLAAFVKKYRANMTNHPEYTRTKVALIDSGVVLVGAKDKGQAKEESQPRSNKAKDDLSERVVDGASFVSIGDEEEPLWWHASEAHGTQMARLICSIDPCCELYVIKVAETRGTGIPPNNVADAINWAVSKGVDVISLSLVTYSRTDKLERAIIDAAASDIVIICSTGDEGVRKPRSVADEKAHEHDVFRIAACTRWGKLLEFSQTDGYDYRFVGDNIHVGQVPFLKSQEAISGSSVATAIAAGTASLTLACCRMSKCDKTVSRWKCRKVRAIFNRMLEGSEQKYAMLENICGHNKTLATADFMKTVYVSFGDDKLKSSIYQ